MVMIPIYMHVPHLDAYSLVHLKHSEVAGSLLLMCLIIKLSPQTWMQGKSITAAVMLGLCAWSSLALLQTVQHFHAQVQIALHRARQPQELNASHRPRLFADSVKELEQKV